MSDNTSITMQDAVNLWIDEHIRRMKALITPELTEVLQDKYKDVIVELRDRYIQEDIQSQLIICRTMMYLNKRLYHMPSGNTILLCSVKELIHTLAHQREHNGFIPVPDTILEKK